MLAKHEIEYKYRADDVKFSKFRTVMLSIPGIKQISAASWDVYYTKPGDENSFQRFRKDPLGPELTVKRKTAESDNWVRLESDLELAVGINEEQVTFHMSLHGYKEDFRIFKASEIFVTDKVNYCFYTVLNHDLENAGAFIEVEVNKTYILKSGCTDPRSVLDEAAEVLEKLGLSKANRMRRSLFEIFTNKRL